MGKLGTVIGGFSVGKGGSSGRHTYILVKRTREGNHSGRVTNVLGLAQWLFTPSIGVSCLGTLDSASSELIHELELGDHEPVNGSKSPDRMIYHGRRCRSATCLSSSLFTLQLALLLEAHQLFLDPLELPDAAFPPSISISPVFQRTNERDHELVSLSHR